MIIRITRMLLLIQAAIAIGFSALAIKRWHVDSPLWALSLGLVAVILLRLLITTNNFFIAWIYRSETPAPFRLGWRRACRLLIDEFKATMWSSSWTMPFQSFDKHIAPHPAGLPVLLVHGYGCNSGYWKSMSTALAKANITHYAIDMEPVLGAIDAYASVVHDAVELLHTDTDAKKIIIVAHSMGGLAARAYVRDHGSARIAKVITLGTPHHGTALANFGVGKNGQQMRWIPDGKQGISSAWLQQLQANEPGATRGLFVSIYSHHDNIISPQISSYLPGAKNIEYAGIGHVALALNSVIQAKVIEEILLTANIAT